jgi:hypothetical protein
MLQEVGLELNMVVLRLSLLSAAVAAAELVKADGASDVQPADRSVQGPRLKFKIP